MKNTTLFKFILSFFWISFSTFINGQTVDVKNEYLISSESIEKKYNPKVDSIISYAKTFLGVPYHHGGSSPLGFDCSGFINYIFKDFGIRLSRSSSALAEFGETILFSDIQPGDLMFFKGRNENSLSIGHVAMVVEVAPNVLNFIHSASSGVKIENFITSKYYLKRFIKAKRLDYGAN